MRKNKFFIILLLVILFSALSTYFIYNHFIIVQEKEYDLDLIVADMAGFNLDNDKIHFGTLPAGNNAERKLNVQNNYNYDVKVNVKTYGNLSEWIYVNENNFWLESKENKEVVLKAYVPKGTEQGTYEGKLEIIFTRF